MKVGIIIVNFKTAGLTIECLHSLAKERENEEYNVVVIDNDSQDGSLERLSTVAIREGWSDWVNVRQSGRNGGFAYGNNIAIRDLLTQEESYDYIYLINPDAYVMPYAIRRLVAFMDENQNVGIVGSRIVGLDDLIQLSSFEFHTWLTELNRGFSLGALSWLINRWVKEPLTMENHAVKTDWVSGASMMIRQSVFEKIGLFDESYFMYYEETDFCLKASRAGIECWYFPESVVVHHVGQSSGINAATMTKRMPNYWFDSRRRYFLKNYGVIHAALADFCWLVGFSSWKLRNFFQRKPDINPPKLFRDTFMNSVFVKGIRVNQANTDIKKE